MVMMSVVVRTLMSSVTVEQENSLEGSMLLCLALSLFTRAIFIINSLYWTIEQCFCFPCKSFDNEHPKQVAAAQHPNPVTNETR
jgi:prephenate dehydratase